MGKGKDPNDTGRAEHASKPLSTLKDPSSFGPPPKNLKYHGTAAVPNQTTPDRSSVGAPLSEEQVDGQNAQQQAQMEDEQPGKPAPPLPFRADRTGLSRTNLPPPPPKRIDSPANSAPTGSSRPKAAPPIPPRRDPIRSQSPSPPPAYSPVPTSTDSNGYLNQQATSNLSRSGVSVPALGIGDNNSAGNAPANELQSRFERMNTNSPSSTSPAPPPPSRGMDASSVKSSISNFRERHSDQIDAGKQKISGVNEKYGISRRVNNFIEDKRSPAPPPQPSRAASTVGTDAVTRKRAPPPPPPKKPEMRASAASTPSPAPPPVPLDTKPR